MRRYLIDTHIFIWNIFNRHKLSKQLCDEFDDYSNIFYLSRLSLWEIAIKNRNGNLPLGEDYAKFISNISKKFGVTILEMNDRHLITLNNLNYPEFHKDPFDHIIVSQAITDKLCLVSADNKMKFYINQGLELLEN